MAADIILPVLDDSSRWYPPVPAAAANRHRSKRWAPLFYCYPNPRARYRRASWSSSCTAGRTRVSRSRKASGRAVIVPRNSYMWVTRVSQETCIPMDRSSWRTPWLTWTEHCNLETEVQSENEVFFFQSWFYISISGEYPLIKYAIIYNSVMSKVYIWLDIRYILNIYICVFAPCSPRGSAWEPSDICRRRAALMVDAEENRPRWTWCDPARRNTTEAAHWVILFRPRRVSSPEPERGYWASAISMSQFRERREARWMAYLPEPGP